MIGFIFDLMGACAHFMWDAFQALTSFGFRLLQAVASVLSWPLRAVLNATPATLGICLVLALGALCLTSYRRARRYK